MRITAFLLFAACLQVTARTEGQTVTLKLSDVPVKEVFREIQKQTGLNIMVDEALLEKAAHVTINVKEMPVSEALNLCLKNELLTYTITDGRIVIRKKDDNQLPQDAGNAPPGEIHGRITNAQGVFLAGANVIINRTKRGMQTNVKGEFILKNVYPDDVLKVSFIGYETQMIKIGSTVEFSIVMQIAKNELDQVVIQGYGQTSQRLATGNITMVKGEEIAKQPVMNPLQGLYGKVPGLVITQTTGYASAPIGVTIRGNANINNAPSDPLFIVDGVPLTLNGTGGRNGAGAIPILTNGDALIGPAGGLSPLFSINPADIESISVLKDADATAIYGSRGANGVVIINTKKGKAGKTSFDAAVYHGIEKVTQRYPMLNTQQYIEMRKEAFRNDGVIPDISNAYDLLEWGDAYTDWQGLFWGNTGKTTDVQATVSGGNNATNFRVSGGYHRATSISNFAGSDQRASVNFNVNHKSADQRFTIDFTGSYAYTQNNLIGLSGDVTMAPNAPRIFDSKGNLNYEGWRLTGFYPFFYILQPYQGGASTLNSSLNMSYQILKGLTFTTGLGFSSANINNYALTPIISQDPASNPTGSSKFGRSVTNQYIIEPQLKYKKLFGKNSIDVLLGATSQYQSLNGVIISGLGYTDDNLLRSVSNALSKQSNDGYYQYKYGAVFTRINLNFANTYILNLTARRDGSSRFGPGKQFGNFGSVGAAWIFTEEKWFKKSLPFLSFGKFRGSYGLTGSDQINDYLYLTRYSANNTYPYLSNAAYVPLQLDNPKLHWQTNKKLEAAIDLGFLHDRLTINVSWYRNRIGDQLVNVPLSRVAGFSQVSDNLNALVQNMGWETTINFKAVQNKNIDWRVSFDAGFNRNKLLKFPNLDQSPYASLYRIGQTLTTKYVLHYTGVSPQTGLYTFQDKNKDGQIHPDNPSQPTTDTYPLDVQQKVMGGFNSSLHYKNWDLDLYFNFIVQKLPGGVITGMPGYINQNEPVEVLNRWQKPGDIARYAKFTATGYDESYGYFYISDGVYSDGSYLKLRNAVLAYNLPEKWMKRIGMRSCKINVTAQNFLTLTKYEGIDPDIPGFGIGMPPSKLITAGIHFTY